ncbi:hypothetical protein N781_06410 [Pontibacillus halophilus JSM 076056 = DSM 19796]|uniref:DUF2071 domain-containing protein n=1 Tax=Pontibacillus halophilus JSM 076056 = DSM 19796 TaxID=1385510 RepID=A0A0A5GBX9_9BACI|nr:DUF2071 domain-containing protein [Pontibacillus halophilus]KGX90696.1 hypothetical protein N781_06410 [Pontibacillus halophilus JSM 076056 = DSM 19796]
MTEKPRKGWVMKQQWNHLLFLHYPIHPEHLQPFLPESLTVDTFEGQAWIGIVPFEMSQIRFKGLPVVPFVSSLYELNVRTYVTYKGERGVYFFSLDANHVLGVQIARSIFHLPYFRAKMRMERMGEKWEFSSRRTHEGKGNPAFHLSYSGGEKLHIDGRRTLVNWLTERYCLFNVHNGFVYKGKIDHNKWELREGHYEIEKNELLQPFQYTFTEAPIAHYSEVLESYIYPFEKEAVQAGE